MSQPDAFTVITDIVDLAVSMRGDAVTTIRLGRRGTRSAATTAERLVAQELEEYAQGRRRTFSFAVAPDGSAFDHSVWEQVGTIPYSGTGSGSFDLVYMEDWDQLAVSEFQDGVTVYDLATPTSPTTAFTITPPFGNSGRVAVDDSGQLWVTETGGATGQVDVYDISAATPSWIGSYGGGWNTYRMVTPFETNALLAGGWQGMQILNWDDPTAVYQETWVKSLQSLAKGGRLVTCGATTGFDPTTDLRHIFYRQLEIIGSTMGSKNELLAPLRFLFNGEMRPVISKVYNLEHTAEAHRLMEARNVLGKIVIRVGSQD